MKKRLFAMFLAGCMALAMTACGEKETENKTETAGETQTVDTSALGSSKLISLGEYKGVSYVPYDTVVTEEEVEAEVQYLVANSYNKNPQEVATETSVVNIDYEGKKDGVAFDGGTAQGTELDLANSHFIAGFAESIVGMKVGETKDCPMTFPEDYHSADLAGQEVVFTITVNECWENVPAQLNDELAAENGYDSVEALYEGLRAELEAYKQQTAKSDMEYQLIQSVIDGSTFEMNEDEITLYVDQLKSEYEYYAMMYGYDLETYVTIASGMTMEAFEEQCREISTYRIQSPLVLSAIAEAEKLEVTEEEYLTRAEGYMSYYGYDTIEALEEAYTKETITLQVTSDMALDYVVDHAAAEE